MGPSPAAHGADSAAGSRQTAQAPLHRPAALADTVGPAAAAAAAAAPAEGTGCAIVGGSCKPHVLSGFAAAAAAAAAPAECSEAVGRRWLGDDDAGGHDELMSHLSIRQTAREVSAVSAGLTGRLVAPVTPVFFDLTKGDEADGPKWEHTTGRRNWRRAAILLLLVPWAFVTMTDLEASFVKKAATREQQERRQGRAMITEAEAKPLKVAEAVESAAEAEAPCLKEGSPESVPSQEATEARNSRSAEALELSGQKPARFQDDTEACKQGKLQQETAAKATEAEDAEQSSDATPLAAQSIDDVPNEEASEISGRSGDAERDAQSKMELARPAVAARARGLEDRAHAAELILFASRLDGAHADLDEAKMTSI